MAEDHRYKWTIAEIIGSIVQNVQREYKKRQTGQTAGILFECIVHARRLYGQIYTNEPNKLRHSLGSENWVILIGVCMKRPRGF